MAENRHDHNETPLVGRSERRKEHKTSPMMIVTKTHSNYTQKGVKLKIPKHNYKYTTYNQILASAVKLIIMRILQKKIRIEIFYFKGFKESKRKKLTNISSRTYVYAKNGKMYFFSFLFAYK